MTEKEGKVLNIEAVVRELGITTRTLRYYEEIGLITPTARTSGKHRYYEPYTIERLKQIIRLKENLGFSLQEIRQILTAEQSLEDLRQTFHQSGQSLEKQKALVDQYIEVLRDVIGKIDAKMQSISSMRNLYQERLERSLQFREKEMDKR